MKKSVLALLVGLLVSAAAFADHPDDSWGIGVVGSGNISYYFYGNLGLSLKAPVVPIFWGVYSNIGYRKLGFTVTGDYYFFDNTMVDTQATNEDGTYHLKLDWYLGIGGFFDLFMWDKVFLNAGVRIPTGVSWHIIKELELCLGIAPGFGVTNLEGWRFHFVIPFEVSFRYWFLK
ncbi:MAG: hypothetical protein LBQ69_06735 [Treponema sp.]|jgi:hypothetical protein|nr:hypothetical protein [Treponema sp.]